jgi:acetyl esterase
VLAGAAGNHVRIRLYFPQKRTAMLPICIYVHGGGFVAGSAGMDTARSFRMANDAHCIVADVDYRLAPEHPFPAAIEDTAAAWIWVTSRAQTYGADPRRCAVVSSSSGSHIAIGATRIALEQGAIPPCLQLLINPVLDPSQSAASYREFSDVPLTNRARMAWYWKQYAGNAAPSGPLWTPLTAEVTGFPTTLIITAEYDVLRDEGQAYAAHLCAAGIDAIVERYPGMIHGFMTLVPNHEVSVAAMNRCIEALRTAFAKPPP